MIIELSNEIANVFPNSVLRLYFIHLLSFCVSLFRFQSAVWQSAAADAFSDNATAGNVSVARFCQSKKVCHQVTVEKGR